MPTNDENRLTNLQRLRDSTRSRTWRELAERCETSEAYLSQIANRLPDSKTGKAKAVGDKLARKLEVGMGLPRGWMDQAREAEAPLDSKTGPDVLSSLSEQEIAAVLALRGLTHDQRQQAIAEIDRMRDSNLRIVAELLDMTRGDQATPQSAAGAASQPGRVSQQLTPYPEPLAQAPKPTTHPDQWPPPRRERPPLQPYPEPFASQMRKRTETPSTRAKRAK